MTLWVLDTSVAVKWFSQVGEADLPQALEIRRKFMVGEVRLVVPELFFVELANALRYNPRFTVHDVEAAVASVWAMEFERTDLSSPTLKEAVRLAYQFQITLYDAMFLALAKAAQAVLVTADEAFCRKVFDPSRVLLLKHLPLPPDPVR